MHYHQYKYYYSMFLFLLFSAGTIANDFESSTQTPHSQKPIVVSLVPDTTVLDTYKRYIGSAYQQIGYKVIFKELPFGRAINLGTKGQVDAMLIRISAIEEQMPEFIRVPVLLAKGKAVLYCHKNVVCHETELDNPNNIIGVFSGINFTNKVMAGKRASTYEISTFEQAEKMFLKQRLPYLISLDKTDLGSYMKENPENFNSIVLAHYQAFHYIHRSKADLLPELTQALEDVMQGNELD
ncbi:hypothetical protein [Thalassotalea agariperforans]